MSEESEIVEAVEEAKKPGTFKIVDVVKERSYPRKQIDVFLNEEAAHIASELDQKVREVEADLDKKSLSPKAIKELDEKREAFITKRDEIIEKLSTEKYVFHIVGISEGKRSELDKKSYERYPAKHETDRNPLSGELTRKEIENPDRIKYFNTLLWSEHIEKIVDPEGNEQVGVTLEDCIVLRDSLPLASIAKISEAIDLIRASTALFMMSVNEDFLAKS